MSEHYWVPYAMSGPYLPAVPYTATPTCETLINMALVGAVIGGSAAAAQNARRMTQGEIDLADAMANIGRTALASAAATAVAGAAAGAVADQGMLRLSLMFGVGATVLYGLNRWTEGQGAGNA